MRLQKSMRIDIVGILFILISLVVVYLFCISCNGEVGAVTDGTSGSVIGDFPDFTPDSEDEDALDIVQTIPPDNSTGIDPSTTIVIFFNDEINPSTVNDQAIQVLVQSKSPDEQIYGTYSGELDTDGNTILKFVPFQALSENTDITVNLNSTGGIEDDGGNTLGADTEFQFTTQEESVPVASGNLGFELGSEGFSFAGDGAIVDSPQGDISAVEGSKMAAISSGSGVVSASSALGYTTSTLTTGSITVPGGKNTLLFSYDFVSAEFDEYVGDEFDDTFIVSVSGPTASHSVVVTSVNIVGTTASSPVTLPDAYITADSTLDDADNTGWVSKSVDISQLGSPISISFSVSDVGDTIYTTIVFIDNIKFE